MKKSNAKSVPKKEKAWWEKPGLGVMYQIEQTPGWKWMRNYDEFNNSIKDENGNLKFNGPFCQIKKWVEFSKIAGVDYHIFESKYHDGICFFNTKYTNWKTPVDYCKMFAEESREAGIPFMFYYSSIFDHNPQFDDIQPLRSATSSFIARHGRTKKDVTDFALKFTRWMYEFTQGKAPENIPMNDFIYNPKKYEEYLLNQLSELIENYKPDGMWIDWYMGNVENSSKLIMDFMEEKYPDVILTFNSSNQARLKWAHYTTFEAHTIKSAWEQGHRYRYKSKPWELVGPAATFWDNPSSRSDPYEAARIAVIVMANGGKFSFGLPSAMDGALYPELTQLVETVGKWYKSRHLLFTEAFPMKYRGKEVPGIQVNEEGFRTIGSIYGNDKMVHIINLHGDQKSLRVSFLNQNWGNIKQVLLEPLGKELPIQRPAWRPFPFSLEPKTTDVVIPEGDVDKIDTIIRIKV